MNGFIPCHISDVITPLQRNPCIIYSNMILTNSVYWKAMEYKFTLKIIVSCSSLNS